MSILTTPLQIGYFIALLFAIIFWYRSYRDERHSDIFLGFVLFFLAMTLQDYTFGFAGINYLWEEMNGFPRYFALAFAPTVWFYLRAQINRNFRFKVADLKHYLPYFIYFVCNLTLFLLGNESVEKFQNSKTGNFLAIIERLAILCSYVYYFYLSLKLYTSYRNWAENQFSNQETISFLWLRNFIYLVIAGEIFKWCWYIADYILHMNYEDDWWWHLLTVAVILYVGIVGFAQAQPIHLFFDEGLLTHPENPNIYDQKEETEIANLHDEKTKTIIAKTNQDLDYTFWEDKLTQFMDTQKPYLDPELTLSDLAKKLKTNSSILSAVINQRFGRNFNDYINGYRIEAFIMLSKKPDYKNLTILAIAFDCGFNSKATFNRAAKKIKNLSPSELIASTDQEVIFTHH